MRVAVHDRDCADGEYKLKIEVDIDSEHCVFPNLESGSVYSVASESFIHIENC